MLIRSEKEQIQEQKRTSSGSIVIIDTMLYKKADANTQLFML